MYEKYTTLVSALKSLTQTDGQGNTTALPMAEDEWYTRPDAASYGIVILDFEAEALNGDNFKKDIANEGSLHLFSRDRSGAGWIQMLTSVLTEHCGPCWGLNSHMYERETGLFHWEWTFQIEDFGAVESLIPDATGVSF